MRETNPAVERRWGGKLLSHGIIGGIVAGIVFAMAEMLMNAAMGEPFLGPLRMISTMVLGMEAMEPTYSLATSLTIGLIVHLILSALFGVIFAYLLSFLRPSMLTTGWLLVYGSLFGLALWVVNFLIIAPIAFPQFTRVNQFWNGFVAHTFFYGTVIGAYIAAVRPARGAVIRAAEERPAEEWRRAG